jgi:cytochrome bd-type quinol oxidase subunit 2
MHAAHSNWLAASLFPLKIYTLFVGVILFYWNEELSPNETDFAYITYFAGLGYFFCATVLIAGGVIQFYKDSRKDGIFSFVCGLVALFIGLLLAFFVHRPYLSPPNLMTL